MRFAVFISLTMTAFAWADDSSPASYHKSEDPRCLFRYSAPQDGAKINLEAYLKETKITEKVWNDNEATASKWLDVMTDPSPYQRKPAKKPKFISGMLHPHDRSPTIEQMVGKHWATDYQFTSGYGHRIHARFKGKKVVPCGFVTVYFSGAKKEMYKQVNEPVLILDGARFFPDRMKP